MLKHMDVASRNQRLRETLEGMGLFVHPVFAPDRPGEIDHMLVAVALPNILQQSAQKTASGPVAPPVPCPQVVGVVEPPDDGGSSVINFPTIIR